MVKAARFELRAEPEQLKRWKAAAEADGRSLGDWLARLADEEAKRARAILPTPTPGQFLVVKASERQTLEQFRLALLYAIENLGLSPTTEAMQEIVSRLEWPSARAKSGGHIFSAGEQELIRKAQMFAAKRPQ